jgi:hypothetical protein
MKSRLGLLILVIGLFVSIPALAHHGSAAFEAGKAVTLKGTVKSWVYSNPHCLLTLDVKGDNEGEWILETQAPAVVYPDGYHKDSFKPGDEVTITAQPVKDGRLVGRVIQAILANGTKLGRLPGEGAPGGNR